MDADFAQIAAAGFNALRTYSLPGLEFLDLAARHGLAVCGGLEWHQSADFLRDPSLLAAARLRLSDYLGQHRGHPALAVVYVGNEIPGDLVRWMGPDRVRRAIESLIDAGKSCAPEALFAYANYPTTEYLEPANADFSAFNVYLESAVAFDAYLRRLHHIAGDRPLVISEFGLDSRRNGLARQAGTLCWALEAARDRHAAGFTVYAWSDRWWNAGAEVTDWDFGLTDRQHEPKPALAAVSAWHRTEPSPAPLADPRISVIVCTRNGRRRIGGCLAACAGLADANHEVVVVDDGSRDGTADWVAAHHPEVRLVRCGAVGLSAARNAGAAAADGGILAFTDDDCEPDRDWLGELRRAFGSGAFAAVGGPNLAPEPRSWQEAVVCAAPGAPSHVLLDDVEAEHLPGCNLAVTRVAFAAVGGFDPRFTTAGDDVDFCWRLRDAGFRLGFSPAAFVWHHRRPTVIRFLRQQAGYGRAERLLLAKHPQRFSAGGGTRWEGVVYEGGPVRAGSEAIIYHGAMGMAGYQSVLLRSQPLRDLHRSFRTPWGRGACRFLAILQPQIRSWFRSHRWHSTAVRDKAPTLGAASVELAITTTDGRGRVGFLHELLEHGWQPGGACDAWDACLHETRVLLATETGEGPARRTLVRVWGNPDRLPAAWRKAGMAPP